MFRHTGIALVIAGALALSACNAPAPNTPATAATTQTPLGVPATTVSADAFAKVRDAAGFQVGAAAAPVAYILFDPQCPHCGALWSAAKPLYEKVSVKWIPVALLKPESLTQSALLISSTDASALMNAHEAAMLAQQSDTLTGVPDEKSKAAAMGNLELMVNVLGSRSIPTIVYLDPVTKHPQFVAGSTSTEKLAELLGVPFVAPAAK